MPSVGTAIGSSGDRPESLAELVGILVNDGRRLPLARVSELHFGEGTPYQIMMDRFVGMREAEIPFLSVNLLGKHLAREDLVGAVEVALDETGFPASRLRLELTESAIIDNPRRAASQLGQLRFLGVRILMDDFGTGHSSLSYLRNLPIDTLKIDRSLIGRMTQDPDGAELVRTIIG